MLRSNDARACTAAPSPHELFYRFVQQFHSLIIQEINEPVITVVYTLFENHSKKVSPFFLSRFLASKWPRNGLKPNPKKWDFFGIFKPLWVFLFSAISRFSLSKNICKNSNFTKQLLVKGFVSWQTNVAIHPDQFELYFNACVFLEINDEKNDKVLIFTEKIFHFQSSWIKVRFKISSTVFIVLWDPLKILGGKLNRHKTSERTICFSLNFNCSILSRIFIKSWEETAL